MKALHAGYVSGALWKAIQDAQLSAELNWQDVLGRLSHFVIDHDVGGEKALPPELTVLENILCRGLPTLPSLYVERQLQHLSRATRCGWRGNKGVAAVACEFDPALDGAFKSLLERALCAVSPSAEFEPASGFEIPPFDSQAEQEFFEGPLMRLLGPGGMQLVARQRQLDSMNVEKPEMFVEQKTDFSVQFPGTIDTPCGIVFEVDGPQHEHTAVVDHARDTAVQKARWAKTYRRRLWKGEHATALIDPKQTDIAAILNHPYLRRIQQNVTEPLYGSEAGHRARLVALFPFAVARVQRVLLELVRGGVLSLDAPAWTLVVVDRDGLSGCGRTAALDFRLWLRRLWALYQPGRRVPEIRVHEIGQGAVGGPLPPTADALLDVSVEHRYGVSLPTPAALNAVDVTERVAIRSDYWKTEPLHGLAFGDPLSLQIEGAAAERHLTFFLRNIFRKAAFRPKQVEIITRALRNESVIALLPTGAGKSITYQLPTMLQNGITMVVDPIKSLMKDQDDNLKTICISASAFINSMSGSKERRQNMERMQAGCFKFIFVSPERFIIREFRDVLDKMKLEGRVFCAYAVVDEAHCVSEWGHDFRTAYLRLGANARRFCPARVPRLPLLGLTGTASYEVLDDVHIELGYAKDANIAVRPESMERKNLHYRVIRLEPLPVMAKGADAMTIKKTIGQAKLAQLPGVITTLTNNLKGQSAESFFAGSNGSGLVFCPHARWTHGAEAACAAVKAAFPIAKDSFGVYHGKLAALVGGASDPIKTQNDFKSGKLKLLACTKAFGMGIDKPDIRFTLHYNIPPSLESFYQEAGRAGRDNEVAQCWILYAGVPMGEGQRSLDYALNHDFHETAFPGAAIEEAKVFELLSENRTPGHSVPKSLSNLLFEESGVDYFVRAWTKGGLHRLYINHPDFDGKDVDVHINLTTTDQLTSGVTNPFPDHVQIIQWGVDWLVANKPADKSYVDWIFDFESPTVSAGLEELLARMPPGGGGSMPVCLSFDNGYLEEIADKYGAPTEAVVKGFSYARDAVEFIADLKTAHVTIPTGDEKWVTAVFLKIRLREHTFRAIYRLTVLGAVGDFEADYKSSTITAWLCPQPEGGYREKLRAYVERYAPMDVARYLEAADKCEHKTELRRCLHALIQFVYARIAKQRLASLLIMEQTTEKGLETSDAFTEAVTTFFDSKYIPVLRPFLNQYTPDLVFVICADTAGGRAQVAHLLGACNRLLPENPDNAAFHALRAYAMALLGYKDQDVKDDIVAALSGFEQYHGFGQREKHAFLMKMRGEISMVNMRCARVFDACIIEDHTQWLRNFNRQQDE